MIEDRINIATSLEAKVPTIIEIFTKYYGEEERERITKIFSSVTYVGYLDLNAIKSLVFDLRKQIYNNSGNQFLESMGLEVSEENYNKFFGSQFTGYGDNLANFYAYEIDHVQWKKESALKAIEELFGEKVEIDSPEYKKYRETILSYKEKYDRAIAICNEELKRFEQLFQLEKELKDYESKVSAKYKTKYLEAISEYLSEHDKSLIGKEQFLHNFDCYELLVGYSYESKCLLDAFSKDSEEKLHNPKTREYTKNSIIEDRINYYKKSGLDLGDEYEDYLESDEAKKITPSFEFVDKIRGIKDKLVQEEKNEMVRGLKTLEPLLENIKSLGLENHDYGFYEIVRDNTTCVTPNFIRNGDSVEVHPLLYICGGSGLDSMDCRIIHECNHIYELSLLGYDGEEANFACGWDICKEKVAHTDIESISDSQHEHRPYEMLNEIINELLAQDITTLMHESGIYLYGDEKTSKNSSFSSYGFATRLVWDFFQTYKPEIIASRKEYNMDILFNKVGKENFMEMNQLVKDYLEYFAGFKGLNTITAIKEGRENEDTRYYFECLENAKRITENMHKFRIEDGFRL